MFEEYKRIIHATTALDSDVGQSLHDMVEELLERSSQCVTADRDFHDKIEATASTFRRIEIKRRPNTYP